MSLVPVPGASSAPSSTPSPRARVPRARRSGRLLAAPAALVVATLALALTVLGAGPAAAHDAFTGSNPTDGSTVATTPDAVTLDFEEPPTTIGLTVKVTGPSGDVEDGAATIVGSTVVQQLRPGAPAGTYRIAWRVTSDDGHPVSGELSFTSSAANARGDATATPLTPGTPGTSASASASSEASAETSSASPTTSPTAVAASPTSSAGDGGGSALPVVLVVVLVALAAAAIALVLRRRRSL